MNLPVCEADYLDGMRSHGSKGGMWLGPIETTIRCGGFAIRRCLV